MNALGRDIDNPGQDTAGLIGELGITHGKHAVDESTVHTNTPIACLEALQGFALRLKEPDGTGVIENPRLHGRRRLIDRGAKRMCQEPAERHDV